MRAAEGQGASELIGLRKRLGEGIAGQVARERRPVLVTDVEHDSRISSTGLNRAGARHYRSKSFIAVPLIHHAGLLGEMNITEKNSGAPFTADDLRLLSILGGHVASAVSSALAAEELRRTNKALKEKMSSARETLRKTNEKLASAEGFAYAIARGLAGAAVAFDCELNITFADETAAELLGLEYGGSLKGHPARAGRASLADAALEAVEQGSTRTLSLGSPEAGPGMSLTVVVAPLRLSDGNISGGTILAAPNSPVLIPQRET